AHASFEKLSNDLVKAIGHRARLSNYARYLFDNAPEGSGLDLFSSGVISGGREPPGDKNGPPPCLLSWKPRKPGRAPLSQNRKCERCWTPPELVGARTRASNGSKWISGLPRRCAASSATPVPSSTAIGTAPPSSVMNARRLIRSPCRRVLQARQEHRGQSLLPS